MRPCGALLSRRCRVRWLATHGVARFSKYGVWSRSWLVRFQDVVGLSAVADFATVRAPNTRPADTTAAVATWAVRVRRAPPASRRRVVVRIWGASPRHSAGAQDER